MVVVLRLFVELFKIKKNIQHEIGNYLHQIISNAQCIEHSDFSEYIEKIKNAAYKIDAIMTDSDISNKKIYIDKNSKTYIDFDKLYNLNILIVDDMIENIRMVEGIFKTLSCNIFTAMSGEEAIELFKKGCKPDIVCMDIIMPGIDGVQTTIKLKKLGCTAYFIAISALKNQKNETIAIFDCWLSKPFTSEQIKSALSKYEVPKKKIIPKKIFKLQDEISMEIQEDILCLAQNGAYSDLEKLICSIPSSKSKSFLYLALKKIDFDSIIKSIDK